MKLPPLRSLATYQAEFLTVQALAEHLGVDERTITRLIDDGKLRAVRVGRSWRIYTSSARELFHGEVSRADVSRGATSSSI